MSSHEEGLVARLRNLAKRMRAEGYEPDADRVDEAASLISTQAGGGPTTPAPSPAGVPDGFVLMPLYAAEALARAQRKLEAYIGVCSGDKELTETVLPMVRTAIAGIASAPPSEVKP